MSIYKKIIVVLIIVVVALAVIVFIKKERTQQIPSDTNPISQKTNGTPVRRVTLQEKFADDSYAIFGVIPTPTPCYRVEVTSAKTGDNTYIISLMTQSTQRPDEMCAQVVTNQAFEYTFDAPEDAVFVGAIDGEIVEFNRVRLPKGEEFIDPIEFTNN